jgi:hypothetical protein
MVSLITYLAPFLDTDASSAARFYRLHELTPGASWLERPKRVSNGMQMILHSVPGLCFEMEASTYLTNWTPLVRITNTLGVVQFTDPAGANFSQRFYRARRSY